MAAENLDFTPRNLIAAAAGRGKEVRAHWDEDDQYEDVWDGPDEPAEEPERAAQQDAGPQKDFVHLHVHSEYSLLDGLSPVKQIVSTVKAAGMKAVALTDHGNLYGALDFYEYAKSSGIKPIIGVEAYVSPRGMTDKSGAQDRNYFHLVLLAKNNTGYQNLLRLVTKANLEGYYYKPRVDRATLAEHAEGLIALSACYSGEPSRAVLDGDPKKAREAAKWYREVFGEDYFLELQQHDNPEDVIVNRGLLEIHRELGIPVVVTNDTHYAQQSQAYAQDLLLAIQTNSLVDDPKRVMKMSPEKAPFYLKSPNDMWALFENEAPQALLNTVAIAERCDLKLDFNRLNFPALDHVVPRGMEPQEFLAKTCRERLVQRYGSKLTDTHRERLEYELDVIQKTGFASYILFVWDFVDWARKRGITCGPRGSAAGSIILYCLGISDVDPVGYGLTFERFLNPERIQMPDIDMDFADDRREDVIKYVVERYGRERVAQIITFGRLLARAAIRDVGRAMNLPLNEVDRVAKLVPTIPIGLKLNQALEESPELKRAYESDPQVAKLIDAAKSVEGVARHAGTHAAGVVVADQPLWNYVPLQKPSRGEGQMTQYSMKGLEKIGLLKMDFLGLANLTMLAKAIENIKKTRGVSIDLSALPLDDAKTYEMLGRGETKTVFQLEGAGMTRYIQELKPVNVDHLAAMVALYRPGPMAHIPNYIARREGREPATPPDASLQDVLAESYGIIVYQDQVLQVVRKVAGYSLGQADVLRRAMGKKEKAVMEEEGPKFIKAAVEHGYRRETAERLWELLQPFAGYAFNKAHAYCYAFVAYQTAYLKANYPVEWFAAVLTTIGEDTDKVVNVVGECRRMGIEVLRPDVNKSHAHFTVEQVASRTSAIEMRLGVRFGLCAIKNVGEGAVAMIVEEREKNGPYQGLDDFCRRLDLHTVNKRVIESLIKSGAMDELGSKNAPRESLLKGLDAAMASAQRDQRAANSGQTSLFDAFGAGPTAAPVSSFVLPPTEPVSSRERAGWEKEVLGLNFADHPFQEAALWLREKVSHTLGEIEPELGGQKVTLAGVVVGLRKLVTRNKEPMAVVTLEDLTGSRELVAFPRAYAKIADLLKENAILLVEGKVDQRDERVQVLVDDASAWDPPADGTPPPAQAPSSASGELNELPPASTTSPAMGNHANGTSSAVHGRTTGSMSGNDYGHTNGGAEAAASHRVTVRVPRKDDADCVRILEQIHTLVERSPGADQVRLILRDRKGRAVELAKASILLGCTADVLERIRSLVGAENVEAH